MKESLRKAVRVRARERCEYCHLPEAISELPFHFDHVVARKHGGTTDVENLAFACCYCNYYKGTDLSGLDPISGEMVSLFTPRNHLWSDHFVWDGPTIVAKTAVGRATIQVLRLNRGDAVAVRQLLILAGDFDLE